MAPWKGSWVAHRALVKSAVAGEEFLKEAAIWRIGSSSPGRVVGKHVLGRWTRGKYWRPKSDWFKVIVALSGQSGCGNS